LKMWFKNWKTKLYTCKRTSDQKRYQIDYILLKQRFRNSIRDKKILPEADIDSDHVFLK